MGLVLWDFSGKNTGVGCHSLLQIIFLTQESNLHLLCFLHCRQILFTHSQGAFNVRPPQTTILLFCISFLGMVLIPASCTMLRTYVHSSSGTLSIRSNPFNLFLTSTV